MQAFVEPLKELAEFEEIQKEIPFSFMYFSYSLAMYIRSRSGILGLYVD